MLDTPTFVLHKMSSSKSNFKAAALAKCYDLFSKNKTKRTYASQEVSASLVAGVVEKIEAATPQPVAINSDPAPTEAVSPITPDQEVESPQGHLGLNNPQSRDSELGASALSTESELGATQKRNFAIALIDPEQLWDNFFSTLIESSSHAVRDKVEELQSQLVHSIEVRHAVKRGEHRFAEVLDFPLKLMLTPLKRGRKAANMFASMLEMQFGPLHAALQVGSIVLEWNDNSLVTPYLCAYEDEVMLKIDMQPHSEWVRYTEKHHSAMRESAEQLNYPEQIEFVYAVTAEKKKLIDALVSVVIEYNKRHYYNLFSRNCQHFVRDALDALQVEIPRELQGDLGNYYKALVDGKTPSVPAKFQTHSDLDLYVMGKQKDKLLADMPQHDLEYLLALYFRLHLESKTQLRKDAKALDEWRCQEKNCCMGTIERVIKVESMKLHNFKTIS